MKKPKKPKRPVSKPVSIPAKKASAPKPAAKKSPAPKKSSAKKAPAPKSKQTNVGKAYRGKTKYIDREPKEERDYVIVFDNGQKVAVSKVKSIKVFDANNKNADKALVEINSERYGLKVRSGVDSETFDKNLMSGKPLKVDDQKVFPEGKERYKLGSSDTHRVLVHTNKVPRPPKKKR